jgi:carbon storage regulator
MLVLSRRIGESLMINGNVRLFVASVRGRTVRLGIQAPKEVAVVRAELEVKGPLRGPRP